MAYTGCSSTITSNVCVCVSASLCLSVSLLFAVCHSRSLFYLYDVDEVIFHWDHRTEQTRLHILRVYIEELWTGEERREWGRAWRRVAKRGVEKGVEREIWGTRGVGRGSM